MEAVVLAGGFGTRLRHVVPDLPKAMAPVAGRPFLEILLSALARNEFHRVVLSLGYLAEKVVTYFGDSFNGLELVYEIENFPLGTGGAVRQSLQRCKADHVYVFNGDTYIDLKVTDVERQWQKNKRPIIVTREVPDTFRYGRFLLESGRVVGISEKGRSGSGLINAGCYLLPIGALDQFAPGRSFSFETDYLAHVVKNNLLDIFVTKGHFIDIGVPDDYARAQIELAKYC